MSNAGKATVTHHPLIGALLTRMRDENTSSGAFRRHLHEIARLMTFEVTKHIELREITVKTPVGEASGHELVRPIVLVPILRAGLGMLNGMIDILPDAHVGHIGMARNEQTHLPETYYLNLPPSTPEADVLLIDPMLATGNSAADAAAKLKEEGATRLHFISLIAAPEGVENFNSRHPDIPIYTASIDERLDENAYIIPGLGDAGDRYFGTI